MSTDVSTYLTKVYATLAYGIAFTALGTQVPWHLPWMLSAVALLVSIFFVAIGTNVWEKLMAFTVHSLCQGVLLSTALENVPNETLLLATSTLLVMFVTISATSLTFRHEHIGYGSLGSILMALIYMNLVNLYIQSEVLLTIECVVGLVSFSAYLLVDTIKIVQEFQSGIEDVVWHALAIYLDVLNLFIRLIELITVAKDDKDKKED